MYSSLLGSEEADVSEHNAVMWWGLSGIEKMLESDDMSDDMEHSPRG